MLPPPKLNSIEFVEDLDPVWGVHIRIDGRDLIDIVREVELPFARREGAEGLAGGYAGLPSKWVFLPCRNLLGEPLFGGDKASLLSCGGCGEVECWPLEATITVTEETVVWSNFCQPHRGPNTKAKAGEWRYDDFGPFTFDRQQYEQALIKRPAK